jgi:hypothetical protein
MRGTRFRNKAFRRKLKPAAEATLRKIKRARLEDDAPRERQRTTIPVVPHLRLDEADKIRVEAILVAQEHIGEGSAQA